MVGQEDRADLERAAVLVQESIMLLHMVISLMVGGARYMWEDFMGKRQMEKSPLVLFYGGKRNCRMGWGGQAVLVG